MNRYLTDFGKGSWINPRTGFPAKPPNIRYEGKWNYHFYDNFIIRGNFGSEYCCDDLFYFKPKVLGIKNIRRLEKKYFNCKEKENSERNRLSVSLGFNRWTEPDFENWSVKNINNKWKEIFLTDEQIAIAKMIQSYRNRSKILYRCFKFALETETASKYGFDLNTKNRNNDRSLEEKRIVYFINNRRYSFLYLLRSVYDEWQIEFNEINFQIFEEIL